MKRTTWRLLAPLTLAACSVTEPSPPAGAAPSLGTAAVLPGPAREVAWGERVALRVGNRTVERVELGGKSTAWTRTGDHVVFDLPPAPLPAEPGLPATPEAYTQRATVTAQVFSTGPATAPTSGSWRPSGAVVPGEVNVLLPVEGCPRGGEPFAGLAVVNRSTTERLCFVTVDIGQRDTAATLDTLGRRPGTLAVSRNVLFSLDQLGTPNSYDPSCEQVRRYLDPNARSYALLQRASLGGLVGVGAGSPTGAGVTVALLGGGVRPGWLGNPAGVLPGHNFVDPGERPLDAFACDLDTDSLPDLAGHETQVADIIQTIAPGARIVPLKTCDDRGNCPSAYSVMALMTLINPPYDGRVIANMSSGGPLPDPTLYALLRRPELNDPTRFLLVASAGNLGVAVAHYPAGYAPGAPSPGSLPNVVAVGAFGQTGAGGYQAARFNTAANFELLAPGVNVCTTPAARFRCSAGAPYPDHLGVSGTSYAAPHVTGVAALYAEADPGGNLRRWLISSAKADVQGAAVGRVHFTAPGPTPPVR